MERVRLDPPQLIAAATRTPADAWIENSDEAPKTNGVNWFYERLGTDEAALVILDQLHVTISWSPNGDTDWTDVAAFDVDFYRPSDSDPSPSISDLFEDEIDRIIDLRLTTKRPTKDELQAKLRAFIDRYGGEHPQAPLGEIEDLIHARDLRRKRIVDHHRRRLVAMMEDESGPLDPEVVARFERLLNRDEPKTSPDT